MDEIQEERPMLVPMDELDADVSQCEGHIRVVVVVALRSGFAIAAADLESLLVRPYVPLAESGSRVAGPSSTSALLATLGSRASRTSKGPGGAFVTSNRSRKRF